MMLTLMDAPAAAATPAPAADARRSALLQRMKLQCRAAELALADLSAGLAAATVQDWTGAKARFEAVIANCGVSPASQPARILRAELAWRDKDYAGVLAWLKDTPRVGPSRLNLTASMLAMRADREVGDKAAFARERSALEAAEAHALASGGEVLGSFDVDGTRVSAYRVNLAQGSFQRLIAFTVSPADPLALPESLMLTDDRAARAVVKQVGKGGEQAPYFLDAYTCFGHVTVKMVPGAGDQPPGYDTLKPLVIDYLKARSGASSQAAPTDVACAWPQYVAPGLTN
jgi:hypothetical protein